MVWKRRLLGGILAGGLVLSTLPPPVYAGGDKTESSAQVAFRTADPVNPVRPVNPDRPGSGEEFDWNEEEPDRRDEGVLLGDSPIPCVLTPRSPESGATGAAGWLTIDYVTPMDFYKKMDDTTYSTVSARPHLQVTDRRGTAGGWKVTAAASFWEEGEDSAGEIEALLRLDGTKPVSASPQLTPPYGEESIELPGDGISERRVLLASRDEGVGTWLARWYLRKGIPEDVQLLLSEPLSEASWIMGWVLWSICDAP